MKRFEGEVRRAEEAERETLAAALTRAFLDDPVMSWTIKPEGMRPRVLDRIFRVRLRQLMRHSETWTTDDLAGAAVWAPPGHWKTTTREDLELARCTLHPRLLWRAPVVSRGLLGVENAHPPSPPHWYLAILGTEPASQGQGMGSAMLQPILHECDSDGVAAYLESSKERNLAFYGRHGFKVTRELHLPRGPTIWQMWRDPA